MRRRWNQTPAGKAYDKNANLKSRTGWTVAMRDAALAAQGGVCAICPRVMTQVNCDHQHAPKKPRALLCQACNISLGYYEKWQKPAGLNILAYDEYLARYA